MGRVDGKVVIVTGAASGLGAADARLLAREGATVVLADVDDERGRVAAADIDGAVFVNLDVREEARWRAVIGETVERFGRLDVLVNNAGIQRFASIEDSTLEEYRLLSAVISEGTFLGTKHAIPAIARSGGGAIVNVASIAAIRGIPEIPAYSAAKGAVLALTRSVAAYTRMRGYGITVNAIIPGPYDTPMSHAAAEVLGTSSSVDADGGVPADGDPADVANLVLFLASDEARAITGAAITIDNGMTLR